MVALVPVSGETLSALLAGEVVAGPVRAYAASPLLLDTFDLTQDDDEESERTALQVASVAALLEIGRRLVVVSEQPYAPDPDGYLGEGSVPQLSGVTAVFADAPEAAAAVADARHAAAGLPLDEAWDLPQVQSLLTEHDLLWFGPDEAATLAEA